ncbi:MAG: TolC family protein [Alphaproteobacteria bacterium]|nr:TolC family protein [Alphaproteobacteria bacterium]
MSYLKKTLLTGAALLSLAGAFPAGAESLPDAVAAALEGHPGIAAAVATRDVAGQEKREQTAAYFPTLDVQAAGGRIYGDNATSRGLSVTRGAGYSWFGEGSVTLTQMMFDGLETPNRVDAARARVQAADFDVVDARERLALRAVLAYLDVVRGREIAAAMASHQQTMESYLSRIRKMISDGGADESMGVQAADITMQLRNSLTDIEGQLRKSGAEYAEVTGGDPAPDMARPDFPRAALPETAAVGIERAFRKNPLIGSAVLEEAAFSHDKAAERATLYPDLNTELSYLKRDQADIIGGEVVDARALVRMNWNFSTGGAQIARIRKAAYQEAVSRAQREETERKVVKTVEAAYADMETAARRLAVLDDRVALNEKLVKTYQAQFEAAKVNLLQMMQAENTLFNTKVQHLNGLYRHLGAEYAALSAIGILEETLAGAIAPE